MPTHKDDHVEKNGPKAAPAAKPAADPVVGQARHAETAEEAAKIREMETAKIPPPGSRNYVAGQPVDEEEYAKTEAEAAQLAAAGKAKRDAEEKARQKDNPPPVEDNAHKDKK